ncbi:MAG: hypothetical protein RBS99_19750, partial [Rhodospirillales bacterium]|nr:hypothetical protein [Rhodospirillales bacterium]
PFIKEAAGSDEFDVTSESFYGPYSLRLKDILKEKGIEIEENFDEEKFVQEDDVNELATKWQRNLQQRGRDQPLALSRRGNGKGHSELLHDAILWSYVKRERTSFIESPVDAVYWVVTVDFGFINLDVSQHRMRGKTTPVCMHPVDMANLLQFWVPASDVLEELFLESFSAPILMGEFDARAEAVTLNIIKSLSQFENATSLSTPAVRALIVDEALRSRVEKSRSSTATVEAIKFALTERVADMEENLKRIEGQLKTQQVVSRTHEEEAREKKRALEKERRKAGDLISEIENKNSLIHELEEKVGALSANMSDEKARGLLDRWFILPNILVVPIVFAFEPMAGKVAAYPLTSFLIWVMALAVTATIAIVKLGNVKGGASERYQRTLRQLRWWLVGGVLLAIFVNVFSSYWDEEVGRFFGRPHK